MFSDDFEAASARLLKELHGQLVAEHRRQVANESLCQQRISAPSIPERTDPSTPRNPPPPLDNYLRGSSSLHSSPSIDEIISYPAYGEMKIGKYGSTDSLRDIEDVQTSDDPAFPFKDVSKESLDSCDSASSLKMYSVPQMPNAPMTNALESDETSEDDAASLPPAPPMEKKETGSRDSQQSGISAVSVTPSPKSCLMVPGEHQNRPKTTQPRVSLLVEPPTTPSRNQSSPLPTTQEEGHHDSKEEPKGKRKSLGNNIVKVGSVDTATGGLAPGEKQTQIDAARDSVMPRLSALATFEVLDIWTIGGSRRTRVLSIRSKSRLVGIGLGSEEQTETKEEGQSLRLRCCSRMISPSSPFHLLWDLFGLLMIAYDFVMFPMEVFDVVDVFFFALFMEWVTRFYWTFNIPITFRSGFVSSNGSVEMRPALVSRRYRRSWLPLDAMCVSIDWGEALAEAMLKSGSLGRVLRALSVLRTLRLLRIMKAPEISTFINERIRSEQVLLSMTIFKSIIAMLGFTHLVACAWYAIGRFAEYGPGESSWIKQDFLQDEGVSLRYTWSIHWALSMVAGELITPPGNQTERIFTIIVLFLCIMVAASFVSVFASTMTQLNIAAREESQKQSILRRYLFDQHISRQLAVRIQKNAQFALAEQKRNVPEGNVELLNHISNPLRVELHFEMHSHALMEHPFFKFYNDVNKPGLRKVCHIGITMLSLSAGDVLFHDLEVPKKKEMFFVTGGGLEYKREGNLGTRVEKPAWLCEAVLWTTWTHCGTATAIGESRLMVLAADVFQECISLFPTEHSREYADAFVELLNQADPRDITDLAFPPEEQKWLIDKVFPEESSEEEEDDDDEWSESEYEGSSDEEGVTMSKQDSLRTLPGIRTSRISARHSHYSTSSSGDRSRSLGQRVSSRSGDIDHLSTGTSGPKSPTGSFMNNSKPMRNSARGDGTSRAGKKSVRNSRNSGRMSSRIRGKHKQPYGSALIRVAGGFRDAGAKILGFRSKRDSTTSLAPPIRLSVGNRDELSPAPVEVVPANSNSSD